MPAAKVEYQFDLTWKPYDWRNPHDTRTETGIVFFDLPFTQENLEDLVRKRYWGNDWSVANVRVTKINGNSVNQCDSSGT